MMQTRKKQRRVVRSSPEAVQKSSIELNREAFAKTRINKNPTDPNRK